jgi:mRNA interferase MazF
VYFNPKKGKEIHKLRPALVISNNWQNEYDDQIIVAPLTSQFVEEVQLFEVLVLPNQKSGLETPSKILLNRLQTIDKKLRLREYIGMIDEKIMSQVRKARARVFAEED